MVDYYTQYKYANLLTPSLEGASKKGTDLWNFRCPYCGDSQKSKLKKRGYLFRREQDLYYKCHNCNTSKMFITFLKENNFALFEEFRKETIKTKIKSKRKPLNIKKMSSNLKSLKRKDSVAFDLQSLQDLAADSEAVKYCASRKIPKEQYSRIFYTENLHQFAKKLSIHKDLPNDSRIIFPFFDANKKLLGFQARALKEASIRYYTIKLKEENPKIFGLDFLDQQKDFYITEGPIDSLFLENSIAMMGAALTDQDLLPNIQKRGIFVYDNEPRNRQIVKSMEKLIESGYKVCIWPRTVKEKDINDMVLAGTTDVAGKISRAIFSGLKAKLEFAKWRKV